MAELKVIYGSIGHWIRCRNIIGALVFVLPGVGPALAQAPVPASISSIENIFRVNDSLYRSAQPTRRQMKKLEEEGVVTVVNLRRFRSDRSKARGTSLRLVHVPINTWTMGQEDIAEALRAIQASRGPVLLHCIHGSDRTGAVIAAYRMVFQGWSREKAIDEFRNGGYGYHAGWFPGIVTLLRDLNVVRLRQEMMLLPGSSE